MTEDRQYKGNDKGSNGYGRKSSGGSYGGRNRGSGNGKSYGSKGGKGGYKPRDGGYKPRDRDGNGRDGDRKPREGGYKPRDGNYKPRESGDRPRNDYHKPRDGNYKPRDRDGDYKPRDRDHRPRDGDYRPRDRDGDFKPRRRDGDSKPHEGGYKPRDGDRRPRDGDYRPRNREGDRRPHDGDFKSRDRRPRDDRRSRDRDHRPREDRESFDNEPKVATLPSTPQKILFKGIDLEVKGKTDQAMSLFLQGAVQMSKGCENNALRVLRDMGSSEYAGFRERLIPICPSDAITYYDFLCLTLTERYDRTPLDASASAGDNLAIYCKIRMEEIEGDDPLIDKFAEGIIENGERVEEGLRLLVRKKHSESAAAHLERNEETKKLRQSIRGTFIKAMGGDESSVKRLDKLAEKFPEAGFLRGYIDAYKAGEPEPYLRDGMSDFQPTIMSMVHELGISDTPYGRFLVAKRMQINEEDWIQSMIGAVKAGSDDALVELRPVQNRKDVRKSLSAIYLANNDAAGLVRLYDGDDRSDLYQYCSNIPERIIEVGRLMGGVREIEWLKLSYVGGTEECKDALIALAQDPERHCKQLVYCLHDVGAELEAAKLYFAMGDDPTLPVLKWLKKVCVDEEAKEYVRSVFEERGDMASFDEIFAADGYVTRHEMKKAGTYKGGKKGGFKGGKGGNGRW